MWLSWLKKLGYVGLSQILFIYHSIDRGLVGWLQTQCEIWNLLKCYYTYCIQTDKKSMKTTHNIPKEASKMTGKIVLVGGGHAHVEVLRRLAEENCTYELILISATNETPYSGMIPGFVSGFYEYADCHINLQKLCQFYHAKFITGKVFKIDATSQSVAYTDEKDESVRILYDVLSINIGCIPKMFTSSKVCKNIIAVKPIDSFCQRWIQVKQSILRTMRTQEQQLHVVVVGAGAGGIESILAIEASLRKDSKTKTTNLQDKLKFTIISKSAQVLKTHHHQVQVIINRILKERCINVIRECEIISVEESCLKSISGSLIHFDFCVCCTNAQGQSWLRESALNLDMGGFIEVLPSLATTNFPNIFAVGDCAHVLNYPRAKAGVIAVRQGPPLSKNIIHALNNQPLEDYIPQETFLSLIGTGNGDCVASKGSMALRGKWLWNLKQCIDKDWISQYTSLIPDILKKDENL